jgi:Tol biopolymer transport system component
LATREEKNLTNTPGFNEFTFAWSPDGERIIFASVRGETNGDGVINLSDSRDLFSISAKGGGERRLDLGGKAVYSPSWSPDGRFILVMEVTPDGQSELWRYDTQNGNLMRLTDPGPYHNPRYSN